MADNCPYPDNQCPDSGENYAGEQLVSKEFRRQLMDNTPAETRKPNVCATEAFAVAKPGPLLLNLRHTIQRRLEQLEPVEIYGSGQTTGHNPVGDITFEYAERKYKLILKDQGLVNG